MEEEKPYPDPDDIPKAVLEWWKLERPETGETIPTEHRDWVVDEYGVEVLVETETQEVFVRHEDM